jgi:Fe-S-cluster containining protein
MRELESQAQEQLRIHRPVCLASGKCCNFEQHGHSMWLTGLEVAWTLSQLPSAPTSSEVAASVRLGNCPFLAQGMCGIHQARPLGCRAYFCDQAGDGWQEAMMESWLGRVRSLHTELNVAYRYDEWRRLLGAFSAQEQDISPLKP